ncbi:FecR family protein [Sinomicrobium oceani]|uniref:FecR family protein n=1 Tax=Sinomicrobium oceani TaxID=1150368 RepID=UPI00227D1316|nr:FecR domain-containing protein [Sinomicrobium oceani]
MASEHVEDLMVKFMTRSISPEELELLEEYLEDPANDRVFKTFIELNHALDDLMNDYNPDTAKQRLLSVIRKEKHDSKRKTRLVYLKYAAAAAILLLVSLPFVFNDSFSDKPVMNAMEGITEIPPGEDRAILTLEDGSNVVLENGEKYTTEKLKSDGKSLVYEKASPGAEEEAAFNYLTVPRGGQFFVRLPDSTGVWLNSESRLKYPVHFTKNRPREVELVYGEAYLDVSSAARHGNMAFKVKTGAQTVEVLGTEFNIKAYRDEHRVTTTLVEGRVAVDNEEMKKMLSPGQQSEIRDGDKDIEVHEVNVAMEIAWKNGLFMFDKMPLEEMMRILSRWYDLQVKFEDEKKKEMVFSGFLSRSENVNELLKNIERTGEVKFLVKEKTVIIQ